MSETSWGTSANEKLGLVNDEEVINLSESKKFIIFPDSVLCLGKVRQFPESNKG